jgi:threonine dehydratase
LEERSGIVHPSVAEPEVMAATEALGWSSRRMPDLARVVVLVGGGGLIGGVASR